MSWSQQRSPVDSSFDPSMWIDDLAVVNARVITLDAARPEAQAVLVRRGRIAAIGTNAEIRGLAKGARILDAGGHGLVPGFVDTHIHIEWSAIATVLIEDLYSPPPKTIAELLARLKVRAAKTPPGRWILAEGYGLERVAEQRLPTLAELDAVSQQHPVVVFNGVHTCVSNFPGGQSHGIPYL